jgi:hypothetical protein
MRLDIGGGHAVAPGHINIDIVPDADIVHDLNKGLPKMEHFVDIEGIRCHQVLEHLTSIIPLLNDCYGVMKEGAQMEISTPLYGTTQAAQDPTHIRCYVPETFLYFQKDSPFNKEQNEYGITARFKIIKSEVLDGWNLNVTLEK